MIKIRGRNVKFTGKDAKTLKEMANKYGLSVQNCFTGLLWEYVMQEARNGTFKKSKKAVVS